MLIISSYHWVFGKIDVCQEKTRVMRHFLSGMYNFEPNCMHVCVCVSSTGLVLQVELLD